MRKILAIEAAMVLALGMAPATALAAEGQVTGWSPDEGSFALRVYATSTSYEGEGDEKPTFCDGYVDHRGKKFQGSLALWLVERGEVVDQMPIQDVRDCTPPALAKERLEAAKAAIAAANVRLTEPAGTCHEFDKAGKVTLTGPSGSFTLEHAVRAKFVELPDDASFGFLRGTETLHIVPKSGKSRVVLSRKLNHGFSRVGAGTLEYKPVAACVSPSKETVVVLGQVVAGSMRGSGTRPRLIGVLSWAGGSLEPY